jgi:hypothetical protein
MLDAGAVQAYVVGGQDYMAMDERRAIKTLLRP